MQQGVALLVRVELAGTPQLLEQDFEVDLVIGHVHACGVVNRVHVEESAPVAVVNAGQLCKSEVRALADHLRPQFGGVNAHVVIGLIPDVQVALQGGFDVGADPSEPEQIHLHPQNRPDDLVARQGVRVHAKQHLRLRTEWNGLGLAVEHAASGTDQIRRVVLPRRAWEPENPITLLPACFRFGIRI